MLPEGLRVHLNVTAWKHTLGFALAHMTSRVLKAQATLRPSYFCEHDGETIVEPSHENTRIGGSIKS